MPTRPSNFLHATLGHLGCLVVSAAASLTTPAAAQSITSRAPSQVGYVGEPLRVSVQVRDVDRFEGPTVADVDGLEIRRLPGEQTSSRIEFVNGRTTQSKTVGMTFEVTPTRLGEFVIPAFTMVVDGQTYSSAPIPITVVASQSGDFLRVEVAGNPKSLFVGERGTLELSILVKRFTDPNLRITLDNSQMWSLIDLPGSSWGVFGPTLQAMQAERRGPRVGSRIVDGAEFVVFTIAKEFDPIAAGPVQTGDIRVRMEYPTALRRGDDFFFGDRLSMVSSRVLSAQPVGVDASVTSAPEGGRPADWNGAVGDFTLEVVARPAEVAVGDPITLSMRLTDRSGRASLEGLQAPELRTQAGFADGFRVPSDSAAGSVDGRSKIFTQSIRAAHDGVREIPPIALTFFDPSRGEYRTVASDPIALAVRPSAVVRLDPELQDGVAAAPRQEFTRVEGGLLANALVAECLRVEAISPARALLTLGVPVAAASVMLVASRVRRRRDPVLEASRSARAQFDRTTEGGATPEVLERALLAFIARRCGVPARNLARKDALDLLSERGVEPAICAEAERVLRDLERARYLGQDADASAARALVASIEAATVEERGGAR